MPIFARFAKAKADPLRWRLPRRRRDDQICEGAVRAVARPDAHPSGLPVAELSDVEHRSRDVIDAHAHRRERHDDSSVKPAVRFRCRRNRALKLALAVSAQPVAGVRQVYVGSETYCMACVRARTTSNSPNGSSGNSVSFRLWHRSFSSTP
jgi:hypothetical protein